MKDKNVYLIETLRKLGIRRVARQCGMSPACVMNWISYGRLPDKEYAGRTRYREAILRVAFEKDIDVDRNKL